MINNSHLGSCDTTAALSDLGEYEERLQIADDETSEQHEAELAPGRLDDRSCCPDNEDNGPTSTIAGGGAFPWRLRTAADT